MAKRQVFTYSYTRERRATYQQNRDAVSALAIQAGYNHSQAHRISANYCNNYYRRPWMRVVPLEILVVTNPADYPWMQELTEVQKLQLTGQQINLRNIVKVIKRDTYYQNFMTLRERLRSEFGNNINTQNSQYQTRSYNRKAPDSPSRKKAAQYLALKQQHNEMMKLPAHQVVERMNDALNLFDTIRNLPASILTRMFNEFHSALTNNSHVEQFRREHNILSRVFNQASVYFNNKSTFAQRIWMPILVTEKDENHKVTAKLLRFFPSYRAMVQNKPVTAKFGKFLSGFKDYMEIDEKQIKKLSDTFSYIFEAEKYWNIEFAESTDKKGWTNVYRNGPHSCMKRSPRQAAIYAHDKSVLRLAYVKQSVTGEILARAIVRDDKHKGYLRVYPDPDGSAVGRYLKDTLKQMGYGNQIKLNGCLLDVVIDKENSANDLTHIYCDWVYLDMGNYGGQYAKLTTVDGKPYFSVCEQQSNAYAGSQQGCVYLHTKDATIVRDYINGQKDKSPDVPQVVVLSSDESITLAA